MGKELINITGFTGTDTTTDPFLLGKTDPRKASMSYNLRAKSGVRVGRHGYQTRVDGTAFKKSGVYFPYGAKAILPNTKIGANLANNFYCAGTTAFSIEFWYKGNFETVARYACHVPSYFGGSFMEHMTADFVASTDHTGETNLVVKFAVDDSGYQEANYSFLDPFPMDGDWHHVAITRASDGTVLVYLDAATAAFTHDTSSNASTAALPTADNFQEDQSEPQFYNHLQIGDSKLSIAEFRIWKDERTFSEIVANYDISLAGTETDLVCYVPFDESNGKHFTDAVTSARGYFSPQEPYINSDNEMVLTGYKCLAIPSLRSRRISTDYTWSDETAYHYARNEDGGYDGGILWDPKITYGTQDWTRTGSTDVYGFYRGTAQLRIRLRQLKEGVICGRLCVVYDETYNKYYLAYYHDQKPNAPAADYMYRFDGGDGNTGFIDESWIGAEKTITIKYDGVGLSPPNLSLTCYIDDTSVSSTAVADPTWGSGNEMDHSSSDYRPYTEMALNTVDLDKEVDAAIGGSPTNNEMCIAFDLLFFRQWWEQYPTQGSSDFASFVANTYAVDDLDDSFKFFKNGVSGYVAGATKGGVVFDATEYLPFDAKEYLQYVRLPIHYGSDKDDMDGTATYLNYGASNLKFKQDVLIKRIVRWSGSVGYWLESGDDYTVSLSGTLGTERRYNDGVISNLVNYYNSETFKNNKRERYVFDSNKGHTGLADVNAVYERNLRIHGVVDDDTPLQGIEVMFGATLNSKYLILSGTGSRTDTIYKQRSMKFRWCTGPINADATEVVPVRGISRFTSEDGKVDKLLAVVGCSVMTVDDTLWTVSDEKFGWIDKNRSEIVNFVTLNNRCVIMDTDKAVKINAKGNFSRLGVERPMAIDLDEIETVAEDTFGSGERYAYVVQYYDSENDVYSGTIPIANEYGQQLYIDAASGHGVDHFGMGLRGCKDENVDRFRAYRTANLEGTGTTALLYLARESGNSKNNALSKFRDAWVDAEIADNDLLSTGHYAVDLVPIPSGAVAAGYGRLFLFGNDEANATLQWSDVDSLGFGKPDQVHPLSSVIVEEGGTTSGTALIEYNGVVYAFKQSSIFRVQQFAPGSFSVDMLYNGVGAINQRCVVLAGNSILFLDKSGLYTYKGGEPVMLTTELIDFFRDQVNQSEIDRSFVLHNKEEETILAFVPGASSTYPDRCVVFDLRTGMATIDLLPSVTCGFIDTTSIYLGTPYGKILEYDTDSYKDLVSTVIDDVSMADLRDSSSGLTVECDTGVFPGDGSIMGARLWLVDETNTKVWTGTIVEENGTTTVIVDAWEPLFNTTITNPSGGYTVYVGHIYFYDKSPILSIPQDVEEKRLIEYTLTTNRLADGEAQLLYKIDVNDGGITDVGNQWLDDHFVDVKTLKGLNRNYLVENGGFYLEEFKIKDVTHHIELTSGRKDQ